MAEMLIGGNHLNIRVWDFMTLPEPVLDINGKETGEVRAVDYVEYGPPHLRSTQTTVARVERLLKARPPRNPNNIHEQAIWARAEVIRPLYEAWKRGEQLPENGTPLAVLNFIRPEEAKVLKGEGVLTVEMLAALHETELSRIRVPQVREKSRQAKLWLEAQDVNKAAAQMAARDATIKDQAEELARLKAMVANIAARVEEPEAEAEVDENGDRIPRRRGRPPKARAEHEEAA